MSPDELRDAAREACSRLAGLPTAEDLRQAKKLVEELRNAREYDLMAKLAEAVSRLDPKDAKNRRLYAQCLIEMGMATVAADVLQPVARRLPASDPEHAEAVGLLGRAHKQIFFDAGDKASPGARNALKQAIAIYREPYERDPAANYWHGVNVLALLTRARRLGLRVAPDLAPDSLARRLVDVLHGLPPERRDEWYLPTLAEASLGLGDWATAEKCIRGYAADDNAKAFLVASTLRQLTQVWDLEALDARGRALVDILRARLAGLPGGKIDLAPADLQRLRAQPAADAGQLEAVLGRQGPETYRWWKAGLDRAAAVAAVYERMGDRIGTAFLVRAGDLGRTPADELLVLTNFHVVNQDGVSPGIRPESAEIVFEAKDAEHRHHVAEILWSSPPERHDASLLRLKEPVAGIDPLTLAASLPAIDETARVYIIGHPRGGALAFSFQDNELLDHEGPPDGHPQIEGVCRLHYRTPTMGGSSGSPVFDSRQWEVVALHHKGGTMGMPRLNGKDGTYGANEGLGLLAMKAEIAAAAP
ncbi:MAG: TRAFs-binding domain-containing protein [Geminicoccaceae bacterium]